MKYQKSGATLRKRLINFLFYIVLLQSPHMELSRYQTLPGKLSKKSEQRTELNGDGAREGEYLSPVQLSPVHSHDQEYSLSESLRH